MLDYQMTVAQIPVAFRFTMRTAVAKYPYLATARLIDGIRLHTIVGPGCSGKSTLACEVMIEAMINRIGDMRPAHDRFRYISAAYATKELGRELFDNEAELEQGLRGVGLLIIDSLHDVPKYGLPQFFHLIADRCDNEKVTIVTCDLDGINKLYAMSESYRRRTVTGTMTKLGVHS
jgi:DNA replication protein DnaC